MSEQQSNVTRETKAKAYAEALRAKAAAEAAKHKYDSLNGAYRNVIKKWETAGVDGDALTHALKIRFDDPDETIRAERAKLEMMEISGHISSIRDSLLGNLHIDPAEPTHEATEIELAQAEDLGMVCGRQGVSKTANPYKPATELYVKWLHGYLHGQRQIADEMEANGQAMEEGTKKRGPKPRLPHGLRIDTAKDVEVVVLEDDEEYRAANPEFQIPDAYADERG